MDALSLSLHKLLRKTPGREEERVRDALCLKSEVVFLNLQDRVLENRSRGAPGSVTREHLGHQVELEPGAREGLNIRWLPGKAAGALLALR